MDLRCSFLVVTSGKPSLRSKRIWCPNTERVPIAGAVALVGAVGENSLDQVMILAHGLSRGTERLDGSRVAEARIAANTARGLYLLPADLRTGK